jgi:uncharacterized protein (TIGR03083 family)
MSLTPMQPTPTVHLFPGLSTALLTILQRLAPGDWSLPTACPGWSVKDVTAHLLGGNLGRLSFQRDRLQRKGAVQAMITNADLVAWIDQQNAAWIIAAQRISAPVLMDFLAMTDRQVYEFFNGLDMEERSGVPVAWAGETRSANWFDIGREYTEKWFHQQHIREAVGVEGLVEQQWLFPVIELCLRALPFTYQTVEAAEGTSITVRITGEAGGVWSLVRHDQSWSLYAGEDAAAVTSVQFSDDTAWRLFSKGLDREALAQRIEIQGNRELGAKIFDLVAIMA